MKPEAEIVYRFKDALYLNITNRCPNLCSFCIKTVWGMDFMGHNLDLKNSEPSAEKVLSELKKEIGRGEVKEVVFCGYGEPTMALPVLIKVADGIKDIATSSGIRLRVRLNTNGFGNIVWGRDITAELKGRIDCVHISLNSAEPGQWLALMNPAAAYREKGFEAVKEFITAAVKNLPEVVVTAVEGTGADTEKVRQMSEKLGAAFRVRPALES